METSTPNGLVPRAITLWTPAKERRGCVRARLPAHSLLVWEPDLRAKKLRARAGLRFTLFLSQRSTRAPRASQPTRHPFRNKMRPTPTPRLYAHLLLHEGEQSSAGKWESLGPSRRRSRKSPRSRVVRIGARGSLAVRREGGVRTGPGDKESNRPRRVGPFANRHRWQQYCIPKVDLTYRGHAWRRDELPPRTGQCASSGRSPRPPNEGVLKTDCILPGKHCRQRRLRVDEQGPALRAVSRQILAAARAIFAG